MLYTYLTQQGEKRLNITFLRPQFHRSQKQITAFNPSQPPLIYQRFAECKMFPKSDRLFSEPRGIYA
ncbi:hypothetical protein A4G19_13915 [Pasteurellaceae bacterium Macca]|nr:hypothetical protein [Pasteurellaceae bacterium Macca]